ncbi:MAG TPA: TetR/AcrR family transcriptional regulator [Rectinemataceae bacterium]|nr:TetR/AcrR family transcriptional regulator [Rectinemataceae bacterium]
MTQDILTSDPEWPYSKAKTAVLAAAAEVISESGPRAATLKNIASRAGITEPAIFRHFDGVDGLFGGLFEAFERVHSRIDRSFDTDEAGMARLRSGLASILQVMVEGREFSYILLHGEQVFRGYPDLRKKIGQYRARERKNMLACVEEGIKRGEVRKDLDAGYLATAAWGMMHLTILSWIEQDFDFDLMSRCGGCWDALERMMAAGGAAAKAGSRRSSSLKQARSRASAALKAAPVVESTSAKPGRSKNQSSRKTPTAARGK